MIDPRAFKGHETGDRMKYYCRHCYEQIRRIGKEWFQVKTPAHRNSWDCRASDTGHEPR